MHKDNFQTFICNIHQIIFLPIHFSVIYSLNPSHKIPIKVTEVCLRQLTGL